MENSIYMLRPIKFTFSKAISMTHKLGSNPRSSSALSTIDAAPKRRTGAPIAALTVTIAAVLSATVAAQPAPIAPSTWELQYLDCVRRANASAGIKLTPAQEQTMLEIARDDWSIAFAPTDSAKSSRPKNNLNPLTDVNKRYGCRI